MMKLPREASCKVRGPDSARSSRDCSLARRAAAATAAIEDADAAGPRVSNPEAPFLLGLPGKPAVPLADPWVPAVSVPPSSAMAMRLLTACTTLAASGASSRRESKPVNACLNPFWPTRFCASGHGISPSVVRVDPASACRHLVVVAAADT